MDELPADLLAVLPDGSEEVARKWWESLSESDRRRTAELWDERFEVRFFAPQADDAGRVDDWDAVPRVTGGRFVPTDDTRGFSEWGPSYFEHLLQHPELVLAYEPVFRTFHMGCTREAVARRCLEVGRVPADFDCPVVREACPLRAIRGAQLSRPRE